MNIEILVDVPGGSPLVDDYVGGDSSATALYDGSHLDLEAYRSKAREVAGRFDGPARERAAAAMLPSAGASAERMEEWIEKGGLVVSAGQQPGLFTGPLYSVYKALTAARLAHTLEEVLRLPVLPLFWVASEDHDWAEVNHTWVVDLENDLRRVDLDDPPAGDGRPIFRVPLGSAVVESVNRLLAELPDTDFSPPLESLLRDAYAEGSTLSEAFRTTLAELLAPFGMVFADAAHPALKEASAHVLSAELEEAGEHEKALAQRAAALEEEGYHVQVPILDGGVNLFVEGPAGRERLYRDDGTFHLRHSGQKLTTEEVRRRLAEDVSSVSPNVLLRPVVESSVFPVVCIVCGPGEISYFAQLQPLFRAHGIRMPVVHPRFTGTLLESKIRKVLDKFELDPESLGKPHHELAGELTREEIPGDVRKAIGQLRGAIGKGSGELIDATRSIDPTLKGPVTHARNQAFAELDEVEKKIVQALKRENEIALGQLEKAQQHLFPGGKPQERMLNVFYYLFRYGRDLLDAIAERFDPPVAATPLEGAPEP